MGLPFVLLLAWGGLSPAARQSGPFVPARDDEALEQLPLSARDPDARELRRLESALRLEPNDLARQLALAQKCIELYRRQADPRYLGRAEAALGRDFDLPAPPPRVRLLRAIVRQSNHDFARALADLDVLVRETPDDPEPWLVRAVVLGVVGRYPEAESDCERTRVLAGALAGAVCSTGPLTMTGRGEEARRAVVAALGRARSAGGSERAWALSSLAEVERSLGRYVEAMEHFEAALALVPNEPYTLAAYADLLLDRGETRRVRELLAGSERIDALLLRLAIAERRAQAPTAGERARELAARFDAARLRGDAVHRREEARFELEVRGDFARAVELAAANWDVQKESADARVLLEAALAAGKSSAAAPAVAFLDHVGSRDPKLRALVRRAGGAS